MVILTRRNFLKSIGGAILSAPLIGLPIRAQELPTLSISLPAQIESFPIAFAADEEQMIFKDHGLNLELTTFTDVSNRNVALFTEELDAVMSDISSIVALVQNGASVKMTSTAYESIDGSRRYTLMTNNFSFVETLDELFSRLGEGNRDFIGLIRQTDMEYNTDLLVESAGQSLNESEMYSGFQDVLDLATQIAVGSFLSGVLPEPIGSYLEYITTASETPVTVLSEFEGLALPPTVLAFQNRILDEQPELVERFYSANHQVLSDLRNTERDTIVDIGIDAALEFFFPGLTRAELPPGGEEFLAEYLIPGFPDPREVSPSDYDPVAQWNVSKGFVSSLVPFETATTNTFIL